MSKVLNISNSSKHLSFLAFCPNCGKDLSQGVSPEDISCPQCAHPLKPVKAQPVVAEKEPVRRAGVDVYKSPGTAAVLGVIIGGIGFMGMGQVYVGQLGRGLGILVVGWLLTAVEVVLIFQIFLATASFGSDSITAYIALLLAIGVGGIDLIFWIWQAYDAHGLAKKFNTAVELNGRAPW